jgi:hypothetical protein
VGLIALIQEEKSLTDFLVLLQMAAISAAIWRLRVDRIRLPFFGTFLAANLVLGVFAWKAAPSLSMNSAVKVWAWGQFVIAVMWILTADELRRRILVQYKGIGRFGLWLVLAAVAVAALAVYATATDYRQTFMRLAVFIPRVVGTTLAIAMALLSGFVARYPALQSSNSIQHGRILTLYFAAQGLSFLAVNVGVQPQNMALFGMVLSMACYVSWATMLSAAGEIIPIPAARGLTLADAQIRSEQAVAALRDVR